VVSSRNSARALRVSSFGHPGFRGPSYRMSCQTNTSPGSPAFAKLPPALSPLVM
jgi:hypothetical protein